MCKVYTDVGGIECFTMGFLRLCKLTWGQAKVSYLGILCRWVYSFRVRMSRSFIRISFRYARRFYVKVLVKVSNEVINHISESVHI